MKHQHVFWTMTGTALIWIGFTATSSHAADSKVTKWYCGTDRYGCEHHYADHAILEVTQSATKLTRIQNETAEEDHKLVFSGPRLETGQSVTLAYDPKNSQFRTGTFEKGKIEVKLSCEKASSTCKLISKGEVENLTRFDGGVTKGPLSDMPQLTNFELSCSSKPIKVSRPKPQECEGAE